MELELKYGIKNKEQALALLQDEYLKNMEEPDSRDVVMMKAVYFDTADFALSRNDIAFRVRQEGVRIVAALKWNGKVEGSFHAREELCVPVDDPACFLKPEPEIFKESEIGKEIIELISGEPLISIVETNFQRNSFRIDSGEAIMEVSFDDGKIITDSGVVPICEVEIELFSGEEEELLALGKILNERYDLLSEVKSKYVRGLELLKLR